MKRKWPTKEDWDQLFRIHETLREEFERFCLSKDTPEMLTVHGKDITVDVYYGEEKP